MSEFSSFWSDNGRTFDAGEKFFCSDSTRREALDDNIIYKEAIQHLLELLNMARQERDEARELLRKSLARTRELQELLDRVSQSISAKSSSKFSHVQGVVSDYTSGTYNSNNSQGSSSVDGITYGTSSPASPNASALDSNDFISKQRHFADSTVFFQMGTSLLSNKIVIDKADSVIDELVKGKPLPEKGKLLQAVMDACPLIETFLDSVPVPKWRNPPPLPRSWIPLSPISADSNLASPSSSVLDFAIGIEPCLNGGLSTRPMGTINPPFIR